MSTQMPAQDPYAPAAWGSPTTFDLVCPSGQRCLARKISLEDFAALGVIDELDRLGMLAEEHNPVKKAKRKNTPQDHKPKAAVVTKAQKAAEEAANRKFMMDLLRDEGKFKNFAVMVDKILTRALIRPQVLRPIAEDVNGKEYPISLEERLEGVVYTDSIGFADKVFIWSEVFDMGTDELEQFRQGPEDPVATMETEPGVRNST